jgi:hypothetical protein
MPPLFNFVLEYPIKKVHENEEELQFNGLHQVAVILKVLICCGRLYTQKKIKQFLLQARKELSLEIKTDKTKYREFFNFVDQFTLCTSWQLVRCLPRGAYEFC